MIERISKLMNGMKGGHTPHSSTESDGQYQSTEGRGYSLNLLMTRTLHFQNVPAGQSTQELKRSNLKPQNGEIDYKKVNNNSQSSVCPPSELFISSGRTRKRRTPN